MVLYFLISLIFIASAYTIVLITLNFAGVILSAVLGSNSNEIDKLYTDLGKSSTDRDDEKN
jgi:hypothetical protein